MSLFSKGTKHFYPPAEMWFAWSAALLSTFLSIGAYTDGWAHHHIAKLETFFTPWHAVLYGAYGLLGLFLVANALWNYHKGYAMRYVLPRGYGLSLIGVFVFFFSGIGDMIWHILFGIEASLDALLSPTHLLLATGAALMTLGPLRSLLLNEIKPKSHLGFFPAIISLTMFFSILTFMTQLSHPVVNVFAGQQKFATITQAFTTQSSVNWIFEDEQARGVESILLQTGILMGIMLYAIKKVKLPAGTFTFLLMVNTVFLSFLEDHFVFIPMAIVAGIIIDILYIYLQPLPEKIFNLRLFAFLTPVVIYGLYLAVVYFTEGIAWSVHMTFGAIFIAGIAGYLLSFVTL